MPAESRLTGIQPTGVRGGWRIGLGNDHAGYRLKLAIGRHLRDAGHDVVDLGHHSDDAASYPTFGRRVAEAVAGGEVERGIVICGTGVGISIAANKVRGVRCACCSESFSAVLSRRHNDTNVLALGARVVGTGAALSIVDAWLAAEFEGGRHSERLAEIRRDEHLAPGAAGPDSFWHATAPDNGR